MKPRYIETPKQTHGAVRAEDALLVKRIKELQRGSHTLDREMLKEELGGKGTIKRTALHRVLREAGFELLENGNYVWYRNPENGREGRIESDTKTGEFSLIVIRKKLKNLFEVDIQEKTHQEEDLKVNGLNEGIRQARQVERNTASENRHGNLENMTTEELVEVAEVIDSEMIQGRIWKIGVDSGDQEVLSALGLALLRNNHLAQKVTDSLAGTFNYDVYMGLAKRPNISEYVLTELWNTGDAQLRKELQSNSAFNESFLVMEILLGNKHRGESNIMNLIGSYNRAPSIQDLIVEHSAEKTNLKEALVEMIRHNDYIYPEVGDKIKLFYKSKIFSDVEVRKAIEERWHGTVSSDPKPYAKEAVRN